MKRLVTCLLTMRDFNADQIMWDFFKGCKLP